MRIVAWNIWHGGAARIGSIEEHLVRWDADVLVLSEVTGSPSSRELARRLATVGYPHQAEMGQPCEAKVNRLLVASKRPITLIDRHTSRDPQRFAHFSVEGFEAEIAGVHIPLRGEKTAKPFMAEIIELAESWGDGPGVIIGDMNLGEPGLDEEARYFLKREGKWFEDLRDRGWVDAWRSLRGSERVYSWYSERKGREPRGFRIDQAFLNPAARASGIEVRYDWARGVDGKPSSDHAALILDLQGRGTPAGSV